MRNSATTATVLLTLCGLFATARVALADDIKTDIVSTPGPTAAVDTDAIRAALALLPRRPTRLSAAQGPAPDGAARPPAAGRLVVFLYVAAPLAEGDRHAGLALADRLLSTARVAVDWRVCEPADPCPPDHGSAGRVTVILTAALRAQCGETAHDPAVPGATVMISVPCLTAAARTIARSQTTRAHPLLARLGMPDLLGAVVAHEIGHGLGLKHAAHGIMRARIGIDDVLAFQQGRLVFDAIQGARMRVAAAIEPELAVCLHVPDVRDVRDECAVHE